MASSMEPGARGLGFKFLIHHLLAMQTPASYLIVLCLCFLNYKSG